MACAAGGAAAVVRRDHAIHVHMVTQFHRNHHGKPARAQPGMGLFPVLARLTPEEVVKLLHAGGRDGIGLHVREHEARPLDDAQEAALGLLHLVWGSPEDEHRLRGPVDKFLGLPQHTEYTGMGHYAEGGFVSDVSRVARGGSIVHADGALSPLNLRAQFGAQQVAGAGDDHTLVAPGRQRLVAEDREVGAGETPLLEVDWPTRAAPQGAVVEDLVGTVGAVEDEDGDEGKEDHKHC